MVDTCIVTYLDGTRKRFTQINKIYNYGYELVLETYGFKNIHIPLQGVMKYETDLDVIYKTKHIKNK